MKCPVCNKKHRSEMGARKCISEVKNQWTFWVISFKAGLQVVPENKKEIYLEDKEKYNQIIKYEKELNK